jgi:hypothetical protein
LTEKFEAEKYALLKYSDLAFIEEFWLRMAMSWVMADSDGALVVSLLPAIADRFKPASALVFSYKKHSIFCRK